MTKDCAVGSGNGFREGHIRDVHARADDIFDGEAGLGQCPPDFFEDETGLFESVLVAHKMTMFVDGSGPGYFKEGTDLNSTAVSRLLFPNRPA